MNWRELQDKNITLIGGAVSGGLDSCTATHWLASKGFDVTAGTVDLGQPDEENIGAIADRMRGCGAVEAFIVPAHEALADAGLKVLQAQARYEGGYWNTTGIARPVTVDALLKEFETRGIPVLFHGATGRGNDQVRFQIATNMLRPDMDVYAPWRDPEFVAEFPGRQQMLEYCGRYDLPIKPAAESRYSTDANFLGLTHEAGDLEGRDRIALLRRAGHGCVGMGRARRATVRNGPLGRGRAEDNRRRAGQCCRAVREGERRRRSAWRRNRPAHC